MAVLKLKIDISGTRGDEAWRALRQYDEIQSAAFGAQFGSHGPCRHAPQLPARTRGVARAEIRLATSLLAQYALSHYLEQARVLDADVED